MERARNVTAFDWAGDPERWGGFSEVTATSNISGLAPVAGQQILRAQTRDLITVAWDLLATWEIEGLTAADLGALSLEMSLGSGQATSKVNWQLATFLRGEATTSQSGGARALGLSPDGLPPSIPWTMTAVIPTGSVGPIPFVPGVFPGFAFESRTVSVGAEVGVATRLDNLYIRDSSTTIIWGVIGLASEFPQLMSGPQEWLGAPSDTPVVTIANPPGAGEQVVVTLNGALVQTGRRGVAITSSPIVACAINARPVLMIGNTVAPHPVTAKVIAHCAPRSWVPNVSKVL